jgi:putative glutamine amidotransferase
MPSMLCDLMYSCQTDSGDFMRIAKSGPLTAKYTFASATFASSKMSSMSDAVRPRIAIPVPTLSELEYNRRAWPQYASAVEAAGGEPVEVPLTLSQSEVARLITGCQGMLLPGAGPDLNPQKYGAEREPASNPDDPARENVDDLLLQDAHNLHKPVFGICYGMQGLNVWRTGTLLQDLAPMPVNHKAGRAVLVAHTVVVAPESLLAEVVEPSGELRASENATDSAQIPGSAGMPGPRLDVNSSHHQAVGIVGDGLRVVARCPEDGVVECVEGTSTDHFVLGVQWHPERTYETSAASRALFARFVAEARAWKPRVVTESVAG